MELLHWHLLQESFQSYLKATMGNILRNDRVDRKENERKGKRKRKKKGERKGKNISVGSELQSSSSPIWLTKNLSLLLRTLSKSLLNTDIQGALTTSLEACSPV